MSRLFYALTLLSLATLAAGQEDQAAATYRIGAHDQVLIRVEEMTDLNQEVSVDEAGTIKLPHLGTVDAAGLTEAELAARLRARLEARGLRKATVMVAVTGFRSRPVSVLGAVGQPGNHPVPGRTTLLEVLMSAGGLLDSHGPEIVVRRRADNGLSDELRIATAELIEDGSPKANIPIFAGDLISVPLAKVLTVHLMGEVSTRGSMSFEPDERATLLTAIARAGGLTDAASKKIRVQRLSPSGERVEIAADFRQILNNKAPDVPLEDGDLIIVKESFF